MQVHKRSSVPKVDQSLKMEEQFNKKHGVRKRSFEIGDSVMVRRFKGNRWLWIKATVQSRAGSVNYMVMLDNSSVVKTHANQMRLMLPSTSQNPHHSTPWLNVMLDLYDTNLDTPAAPLHVPAPPAPPAVVLPPVPLPAPVILPVAAQPVPVVIRPAVLPSTSAPLRRSSRSRHSPMRLRYDLLGNPSL